ncbi:hypothetical protein DRQ53_00630 [bacterium]|nr:MAG: hypothetical protein DRQ53_00630 [bacterium]
MNKLLILIALPLFLCLASCSEDDPAPLAPAETVFKAVFQKGMRPYPEYTAVTDVHLVESRPDLNYNDNSGELAISSSQQPGARIRLLMMFPIQGLLPANIKIKEAVLTLIVRQCEGSGILNVHRMESPWFERSATWNDKGFEAWDGGEFDPAVMASIASCDPDNRVLSIVLDPNLVRDWTRNDVLNRGLLLKFADEETNDAFTLFYDSDMVFSLERFRPYLTIYYTMD